MTLQNFQKSREAMVVSQLQPSGIVSESVMEAYRSVPREMFVPEALRGVSYLDDDMPLGNGRFLLEPLIHARMVQDAEIFASDKILDIGGSMGYSAAILSRLAGEVVALDQDEKMLQAARSKWNELGLKNISAMLGNHAEGYRNGAPYDVIIVNGAVAEIPAPLIAQLANGGRLYCVVQTEENSMGKLVAIFKEGSGQILQKDLGDAATTVLKGFEVVQKFAF